MATSRYLIVLGCLCAVSCARLQAGPIAQVCSEFFRLAQYDQLANPAEIALELDHDPFPEMIPRDLEGGSFRIVQSNEDGQLRSGPTIDYGTDNKASYELAFDLEGDGDLDLLYSTLEGAETGLILLLNDGDGGFAPLFDLQILPRMTRFHAEDVTGDGVKDLLGAGSFSGVYRLTDINQMGFAIEQLVDHSVTGQNVSWCSFGDIDGDGDTDIVGARTGAMVTYLTQEDGSLQRVVRQMPSYVIGMRLVDLDLDGDLDVFGSRGRFVQLLRNDGPGIWAGLGSSEFIRDIHTLLQLEANGDEYPDFVVSYDGGTYMFTGMSEPPYATNARMTGVTTIAGVGDFNADGIDEVGAIDDYGGVRCVQLAPDGSFIETMYATLAGRSNFFRGGLVTDLQSDGDPDFVVRHLGHQVVLNESEAGLRSASAQLNGKSTALELADLNNDGLLDVVAVGSSLRSLSVYLGTGGGSFAPRQYYLLDRSIAGMAVGDVDADGSIDIVLVSIVDSVATLLYNDGTGGFTEINELPIGAGAGDVEIGDLNNNGVPDIVVTYQSGSRRVGVSLGLGGRAFLPTVDYSTLNSADQLDLGDINGDGFLDIITAGNRNNGTDTGHSIAVLYNNAQGFGFFWPAVGVERLNTPQMVRVGDLNHDGLSDIVVLGYVSGSQNMHLRTLIADISGEFFEHSRWDSGVDPELGTEFDLCLFDRDQDGDLDVLAWIGNVSSVGVPEVFFLNDSTGRLVPSSSGMGVGIGSGLFAAGDLTGDGENELVFVHSTLYTLSVLHEDCASYCHPDIDLSGELDAIDVINFVGAFQLRYAIADWNSDGEWNFFDVAGYLAAYLAGCP